MRHILTILTFLLFSAGICSNLLLFLLYYKYKTKTLFYSTLFMFLFNIYAFITILDAYLYNIIRPTGYIPDWVLRTIFFIWFTLFLFFLPLYFHELLNKKPSLVQNVIYKTASLFPLVFMVLPYLIYRDSDRIYHLMQFEIDVLCYVIFYVLFIYLTYLLWRNKNSIENSIRKELYNPFLTLNLIFIPFLLLDAFYPITHFQFKIIPTGLKFSLFYYLTWSFFNIYFAFRHLLKDSSHHSLSITDTFVTTYQISPKEKTVLEKILQGLSNQEISETMFIAPQTVKNYAYNIYQKTGVKSRKELFEKIRETS